MRLRAVDIWGRRIVVARPKIAAQENCPTWWLSRHYLQPPCLRPRNLEAPSLARTRSLGVLGPTLSSVSVP